jgi:hypothetical protein
MINRPDLPLGNVYNEKGYLLSSKNEDGSWSEYTYLDKDDGEKYETSFKTHTGYWRTRTYNEQFNPLEVNDSNGVWEKTEYNKDGQELKTTHSAGHWHVFEYDANGNQTLFERSNGYKLENTYDRHSNVLTEKDTDGAWAKWTYRDDGTLDTHADSKGNDSGYYGVYLYWKAKADRLEAELKQLKG